MEKNFVIYRIFLWVRYFRIFIGLKLPLMTQKVLIEIKNHFFLIIFWDEKVVKPQNYCRNGLIFKKAQLKCTSPRIVIFQKKRNLSVRHWMYILLAVVILG